jgi:trk system potassium uptake protein TrkA
VNNKYAVIGMGQFGTSIARALARRGAEVLAIDISEDNIDQIKDEVAYSVCMDSTDLRALKAQNFEDMDAVVVAIGEDFEALLLTTVQLMQLQIKRLIARAAGMQQRRILEQLGVKEILSPEDEVGKTVAEMLLHPNMKTFLPLPDDYEIVEINTPARVANKSLGEVKLREKYNLNLITIKRKYDEEKNGRIMEVEHIIGVPKGDTILYETDIMILLGKVQDVDRFVQINS